MYLHHSSKSCQNLLIGCKSKSDPKKKEEKEEEEEEEDPEISETLDEVSVSTTFVQSRLVSVSTTTEIPSLDESRSRQPQNLIVSMSLGLNINRISKYRFKRSTHKKLFFLDLLPFPFFSLRKA